MSNIYDRLNSLGETVLNLEEFLNEIVCKKKEFADNNDEQNSKRYWVYEQIIRVHIDYLESFKLIKEKKYYDAWCKLENVEISILFLKPHFPFKNNIYYLSLIESNVIKLQSLYPYRLFTSIEMIKKEVKCNICNKRITPRNSCKHKVGEIYLGVMCIREVTKSELLGIALVENPVNKYTVLFYKDSKDGKIIDHYDYSLINYLFEIVSDPFEKWDLIIHKKFEPHKKYSDLQFEDNCPCNSTEKYGECCLNKEGVEYLHYEFLLPKKIEKGNFRNF